MDKRIKELRLQRKMTLLEVANSLGVSEATAQRYESGEIKNLKYDTIVALAELFKVSPAYLMGWDEVKRSSSTARVLPIIGTVCAGDGVYCEDDFLGDFDLASHIDADFALKVTGDSMIGAHIYDGDYAFIKKDDYFADGDIYAVEMLLTSEASLKKIYVNDNSVILTPCNADYPPVATTLDQIRIIGRCVGVYHNR